MWIKTFYLYSLSLPIPLSPMERKGEKEKVEVSFPPNYGGLHVCGHEIVKQQAAGVVATESSR